MALTETSSSPENSRNGTASIETLVNSSNCGGSGADALLAVRRSCTEPAVNTAPGGTTTGAARCAAFGAKRACSCDASVTLTTVMAESNWFCRRTTRVGPHIAASAASSAALAAAAPEKLLCSARSSGASVRPPRTTEPENGTSMRAYELSVSLVSTTMAPANSPANSRPARTVTRANSRSSPWRSTSGAVSLITSTWHGELAGVTRTLSTCTGCAQPLSTRSAARRRPTGANERGERERRRRHVHAVVDAGDGDRQHDPLRVGEQHGDKADVGLATLHLHVEIADHDVGARRNVPHIAAARRVAARRRHSGEAGLARRLVARRQRGVNADAAGAQLAHTEVFVGVRIEDTQRRLPRAADEHGGVDKRRDAVRRANRGGGGEHAPPPERRVHRDVTLDRPEATRNKVHRNAHGAVGAGRFGFKTNAQPMVGEPNAKLVARRRHGEHGERRGAAARLGREHDVARRWRAERACTPNANSALGSTTVKGSDAASSSHVSAAPADDADADAEADLDLRMRFGTPRALYCA
jgi:hypothetical protein